MECVRVRKLTLWRVFYAFAVALGIGSWTRVWAEVQTISLRAGWNAISVQVEPANVAPAAVFANAPVDKVAAYFPSRTPVEFIQDPASQPWKQKGWRVWYAPQSPEAVISDLYAINAGQCYLVHATAATSLEISGSLVNRRTRWRSDSFNLVGLSVDPANPPTFQSWFAGSPAHQKTSRPFIYALDASDTWKAIDHPESTAIQPNAAYWIFCRGASDYQGPLEVKFPTAALNQADFGDIAESVTIQFANNLPTPLAVTLDLAPADGLPVSYERALRSLGEKISIPFTTTANLGPLEPGANLSFKMTLDRTSMSQASGAAVLTIRDDVGTMIRIPVTGRLP